MPETDARTVPQVSPSSGVSDVALEGFISRFLEVTIMYIRIQYDEGLQLNRLVSGYGAWVAEY